MPFAHEMTHDISHGIFTHADCPTNLEVVSIPKDIILVDAYAQRVIVCLHNFGFVSMKVRDGSSATILRN